MSSEDYLASVVRALVPHEVLDYFDGPRLYSCRSPAGQIFLVLWVSQGEVATNWLYVEISADRYLALKAGDIPIAVAFTQAENSVVWEVAADATGAASVQVVPCDQIDSAVLPPADDCLEWPTGSLPDRLSTTEDAARSSYRGVVDVAITTPSDSQELQAGVLGGVLSSLQDLIHALASDQSTNLRRIPERLRVDNDLAVTGLYAGSFGVRLKASQSQLFHLDEDYTTLHRFQSLMDASGSVESLAEHLPKLNFLTRVRYRRLLTKLSEGDSSADVEWAYPGSVSYRSGLSVQQIRHILSYLDNSPNPEVHVEEHVGRLVGVDVEKNRFDFVSDDGESFIGTLSQQMMGRRYEVPARARATIEAQVTISTLTGNEAWRYVLVDCIPVGQAEA